LKTTFLYANGFVTESSFTIKLKKIWKPVIKLKLLYLP